MADGSEESLEKSLTRFDACWAFLASYGRCDGRGGAEYRRVRQLWIDSTRIGSIIRFIGRHANQGPTVIPLRRSRLPGIDTDRSNL